jgi:hypothetical protein
MRNTAPYIEEWPTLMSMGRACMAVETIDEPPEPSMPRMASRRPSAWSHSTTAVAPRVIAATAGPRSLAAASAARSSPAAAATLNSRPTFGTHSRPLESAISSRLSYPVDVEDTRRRPKTGGGHRVGVNVGVRSGRTTSHAARNGPFHAWGVEPTLGFEPRTCCLRIARSVELDTGHVPSIGVTSAVAEYWNGHRVILASLELGTHDEGEHDGR